MLRHRITFILLLAFVVHCIVLSPEPDLVLVILSLALGRKPFPSGFRYEARLVWFLRQTAVCDSKLLEFSHIRAVKVPKLRQY